MPANTIQFTSNISAIGTTYTGVVTVTTDNIAGSEPVGGIAAAKSGTLSARTDANTGTLTMTTGHGIVTGKVFVFWDGGSRYDVDGTVTGDSIAIDLGSGDDLPAQGTAVTVCAATEEACAATGANVGAALAYANLGPTDGDAYVQFTTSVNAVIATYALGGSQSADGWNGQGTNPFTGQTVAKVKFAHGQTSALVMGGYLYSN